MVAILDIVFPSWEQDIFVVNAPNAVRFGMQLDENIPRGTKQVTLER